MMVTTAKICKFNAQQHCKLFDVKMIAAAQRPDNDDDYFVSWKFFKKIQRQ